MLLSEEDAMNKLNPYVVFDFSLPGSVRQIPDFANHGREVHSGRDLERTSPMSPICDVASTSGDRTVDFCRGGREPPCPLTRPAYPRRRIDTCAAKTASNTGRRILPTTTNGACVVIPLLVVLLIVGYIFIRKG
jgi:hypothetical protein